MILTCQHCKVLFDAKRKDQRFCRLTRECFNAAHAWYKASMRQWYRDHYGEIGKRERAAIEKKREGEKRPFTHCHRRPVAAGNHFLCSKCFAPRSSRVEPQATQYDIHRGVPIL